MTHQHSSPLTCHDLLASLSEYIDGSLEASLCQELERHLSECENCRVVLDTTSKVVYLYQHNAEPESLPSGVQDRLMSALNLRDYLR